MGRLHPVQIMVILYLKFTVLIYNPKCRYANASKNEKLHCSITYTKKGPTVVCSDCLDTFSDRPIEAGKEMSIYFKQAYFGV